MDVMIIPPPRLGGIYEDNRVWARQWQAADPTNRQLVELSNATAQAAVAATRIAARAAGATGNVIYAVGHGGTGGAGHEKSGSADLAPNRALRVTQFVAFSTASTTGWTTSSGTALPSIAQMEQNLTGVLPGRRGGNGLPDTSRGSATEASNKSATAAACNRSTTRLGRSITRIPSAA